MTNNNNDKTVDDDLDKVDPLDELNQLDDDSEVIETEKDPLDVLEQQNVENIPEYNSELGSIIESKSSENNVKDNIIDNISKKGEGNIDSSIPLMDIIDKVDVNNKTMDVEEKSQKLILKEEKHISGTESSVLSKKDDVNKDNDITKTIDNVKVDENNVPLINQFDTDKINSNVFSKIRISRRNIGQLLMIIVGAIFTLIGIIQALDDVVRLSDNVVYGEHETIAMAFIFLGVIIIVLAFYKNIMKFLGFNITNNLDNVNSGDSIPKPRTNAKNNNKDEEK